MVLSRESEELMIGEVKKDDVICQSNQVLGNGAISDIYDIVVVDYEKFDRGKSKDVVSEVSQLNSKLITEKKPYLLLGVGRWGSMDPGLEFPLPGIRFPVHQ